MSKRKVRKRRHLVEAKRRHLVEAKRAEFRQTVGLLAVSVRREINEKAMAISRMAASSLKLSKRPLGLLCGTIPAGQSPKLEPGEFIGMLDCGGNHCTIEELDAAAGPWHELPGEEKL